MHPGENSTVIPPRWLCRIRLTFEAPRLMLEGGFGHFSRKSLISIDENHVTAHLVGYWAHIFETPLEQLGRRSLPGSGEELCR